MKELFDAYKQGNLILFVGAGISRALGLPSWEDLIRQLAPKLDFEEDIFLSYGDFRELAEYYLLEKADNNYKELKKKLIKDWESYSENVKTSKIHKLIAKGNYSTIYTTNYDNFLENALNIFESSKSYNLITNVRDLKKAPRRREIIKFHGDLKLPSKLILGESSYFERLELEDPLDIKFRSDILGKTILFIGYSINDINVRYFLYKLSKTWKTHGKRGKNSISYLFAPTPNPIQKKILANWNINMISPIKHYDNPSQSLTRFLQAISRKEYSNNQFSLFID